MQAEKAKHHAAEAQLEVEHADVTEVAVFIADPDLIAKNRAVYEFMKSARTVESG